MWAPYRIGKETYYFRLAGELLKHSRYTFEMAQAASDLNKDDCQAMKTRHALTNAEYLAEGPNSVRVTDRDRWGRFDRYGVWLEGEIMQCDPQLCIWLTGLLIVQAHGNTAAKSQEAQK